MCRPTSNFPVEKHSAHACMSDLCLNWYDQQDTKKYYSLSNQIAQYHFDNNTLCYILNTVTNLRNKQKKNYNWKIKVEVEVNFFGYIATY